MYADAYRQLSYYGQSNKYSKAEYAAIHEVFNKAVITVCEGQALDMEFVDRVSVDHNEYLDMIAGKTAALLSGALEMGAITAHASDEQRLQLAELGYEMGIAFQIQDDLLDATADPEKFGKRPGGDIYEGKKTYLTILALERAEQSQATFIQKILDKNAPEPNEVEQVLQIMNDLKVLEDVALEIEQHYEKALHLLNQFLTSDYQKELEKLLIFLQHRDH